MEEEIINKKAKWIICEKMRIAEDDSIKEVAIILHNEKTYEVIAIMRDNKTRKIVTGNLSLAYAILQNISIIQLRINDDTN